MCNKEIAHPSLIEHLEPIFAVWQEILEKVQERVRIEALEEEDRVNDPESRFFNDPVSYGLSIYAFYECFHCHKPFFGGRRDCEANLEEDVKPEDLVCRKCSDVPQGQCDLAEHAEYILWKCRFCCEPAIWFCGGATHFCDYCHSHDAGGRMAGTAGNQKERAKCPPPGKEECPSGGNHAPNGIDIDCEFAIGCGMCMNQRKRPPENGEEVNSRD
eukprot:212045_1